MGDDKVYLFLYPLLSLLKNFFSISPKTYYAINYDNNDVKRSSKGVQHSARLTYEDYKSALYESKVKTVQNISIRLHNKKMKTVNSNKRALNNVLFKAFVHDDKISVTPFEKFK